MFSLPPSYGLCLTAFGFCSLGLLVGLAGFLTTSRVCMILRLSVYGLLVSTLTLLLMDAMSVLQEYGEVFVLSGWLATVAGGFVGAHYFGRLLSDSARQRLAAVVLLFVSALASAWFAHRLHVAEIKELQALELTTVAEEPNLAQLRSVKDVFAFTDQGYAIPLATVVKDHQQPSSADILNNSRFTHLQQQVIRVAPSTFHSNCHGWVFTGGRFIVDCDVVDRILSDNDYQPVTEPRTGDIIIYRDAYGRVSHTGLVHSAASGLTLIESKWGNSGRYLHQPQHSIYSHHFSYYRSPRSGHLLRGLQDKIPEQIDRPIAGS